MPYHRGGHPGAVAVSYSTSTMAPLSPSRRYSGSTGSSSGGTSSATGGTTSTYGSYLSSSSSGSDRSAGCYRRTYFSPARSVSSYGESSLIVGSSSSGVSGRYGSASSSSASSTASSSSSSGSRDRNGLHSSATTSSPTTAAEFYAKYSVKNYVPNIDGSTRTGNGHWRPSSSSSVLAELHGGDEYDSCRERRDRSYSSESSSGIGLSINSGISNGGALSPSLTDRWSTRRESKRRNAPIQGSGVTVLAGHAHLDSAPAPTEVTLIAEAGNNVGEILVDRRASSADPNSSFPATIDRTIDAIENGRVDERDEINDTRDVDNNNSPNGDNGNANVELDATVERDHDRRHRRDDPGAGLRRTDENDADDACGDELVLIRNNDFNDDRFVDGRSKNSLIETTIGLDRDHHCHPIRDSRGFNDSSVKSASSSVSSLSSGTASSADGSPVSRVDRLTVDESESAVPVKSELDETNHDERFAVLDTTDNSNCFREKLVGGRLSVTILGDSGDDREADLDRTACAWTKITTNNDNNKLLTNNNDHDRDAAVLGIVEKGRSVGENSPRTNSTTARRLLLWTASNENETMQIERNNADDLSRDEVDNDESGTSGVEKADDDSGEEEERNANGTSSGLRNGVAGRPSGTRGDDPGKPSTSRRTGYGWNDPNVDDIANTNAASSSSSSSAGHSAPAAVHQNIYRGINEQIDESSNSRPPRNRLQSRRDERYGLNGLRNIGNTCFMNSVIQCLSNTRPLLEYLLNEQHLQDINTTTSSMKGALIKAFGQVIHELWEMSGDHVVNTSALKSQIQRFAPRFMGYSQQDAQEFLRYLLEGLHEDVNRVTVKPQPILTDIPDHYSDSHKAAESWKRYLRSEDSTIVDVFVGQLRSSLHCTSCDHVSVTLDPFWDLSLPIPVRSGTVKLNQCLEHFTKVETLDGDEKPTCSKCQMRRKCTKSFSIQKFPKILVIHLKRFSPTERFRGKLSVLVDFPLTGLDLSAFAAPGVQGCTYNLYGVANHSGTTYSGHYTAYCKHPYSGDWHEYNDNRVSTVPARSVVSSEAYVLFYEQQPPSPHL